MRLQKIIDQELTIKVPEEWSARRLVELYAERPVRDELVGPQHVAMSEFRRRSCLLDQRMRQHCAAHLQGERTAGMLRQATRWASRTISR